MKRFLIYIMCVAAALTVSAANPDGVLQFAEKVYDFGTIAEDQGPYVHEYEFVNTADVPVAILSAVADCGCTRPEHPIKPVAPGKKGKIKVTYLPLGRAGTTHSTIKVNYRLAGEKKGKRLTLALRGTVTPKEKN